MKITHIETRGYSMPLDPAFNAAWDPRPRDRFEETIVIVETDSGIRGYAGGASVPDLELLEPLLVGTDLDDTTRILRTLQTVDFHGGRNWTVEVAVFDALARASEKPLWELLGGNRLSFPAYASTGERLDVSARVERTLQWRERGIRAIKLRFNRADWKDDIGVVAAVRDAVGDSMEIMVDANHGWRMPGDHRRAWDLATAVDCARALADMNVYWLEEPLHTDDVDDYAKLRERSDVRIAGGEMVRSLAESRNLIASGAFDVVQNDVVLAGGIGGARQVVGWADTAQIDWSPHTWTTGLGLLANLHVALALSTAEFIEVPYDPPAWSPGRRDFMLPDPVEIGGDGTISPPKGYGLGVEPD
ncbi:MAG: mandelate racemase/muconate lactonizing enzyme family protein, partial [Acidimicrobiia bacterium]